MAVRGDVLTSLYELFQAIELASVNGHRIAETQVGAASLYAIDLGEKGCHVEKPAVT